MTQLTFSPCMLFFVRQACLLESVCLFSFLEVYTFVTASFPKLDQVVILEQEISEQRR